jgi:dTDP-4-amino-4,6-dideoxygalactose transaminase
MITTSDGATAARARRLREHGMDVSAADRHRSREPVIERYTEVGFNYRMTDIQAAIGLVQLRKLDEMIARRRHLAQRYQRLLSGIPGLLMANDPPYGETNYQSFWILLGEDSAVGRDKLMELLAHADISARRGIMAAHMEPAYSATNASLPVTERLTQSSLILPLFHQMTQDEQNYIVSVIVGALTAPSPAPSIR